MRFLTTLSLLLALQAPVSVAQQSVIALEDQSSWNAIGRVNQGGIATLKACTGALVAPDLVLTAEHCVPPIVRTPEAVSNVIFVAGWNRGEYAATSPAVEILVHPEHVSGPLTVPTVASDVALIRLAEPIASVPYLPLWTDPLPERVGFVAYANTRLHAPAISTDCFNVRRADRVQYLTCGVQSGNSGAPMLTGLPDDPRVAGVISAQSNLGALAATVDQWVIDLVTEALQDEPSK